MNKSTIEAVQKLVEWAEAYIENETSITALPRSELTDAEKGALLLIDLLREQP